ncbi:MAG TPA: hypothetical protein VGK53_19445 [Propionicimonas sp.]
MKAVRLLAVVTAALAVAATGCTNPAPTPADLTIDLASDIHICLLDQTSSTVDGTSFALSLYSKKPGRWTLDSLLGNPADGIIITKSWLVKDPDHENPAFGSGFAIPPTNDNPAALARWKDRQALPGAKLEGDAADSVVLLQLNRTGENAGMLTGLDLNYTDTTGSHTQTAAGFTVTLNSPGHPC